MFSLLRIWAQLLLFWITHPGNTQDHSFASQHSGDVKRRKGLEAKGYLQDFPCIHSTQPFSGSLQPNFCVFFIFAYILFNQPFLPEVVIISLERGSMSFSSVSKRISLFLMLPKKRHFHYILKGGRVNL